jgi:hypothetical protein
MAEQIKPADMLSEWEGTQEALFRAAQRLAKIAHADRSASGKALRRATTELLAGIAGQSDLVALLATELVSKPSSRPPRPLRAA